MESQCQDLLLCDKSLWEEADAADAIFNGIAFTCVDDCVRALDLNVLDSDGLTRSAVITWEGDVLATNMNDAEIHLIQHCWSCVRDYVDRRVMVGEVRCFFCGGALSEGTTVFKVQLKTCLVAIRDVPCITCSQCGETEFMDITMQVIERIVDDCRPVAQEVVVRDYETETDRA